MKKLNFLTVVFVAVLGVNALAGGGGGGVILESQIPTTLSVKFIGFDRGEFAFDLKNSVGFELQTLKMRAEEMSNSTLDAILRSKDSGKFEIAD